MTFPVALRRGRPLFLHTKENDLLSQNYKVRLASPDFVPPNECVITFGSDGTFSSWREHRANDGSRPI